MESREATDEIVLSQEAVGNDLIAARLNDDELDDIIVFTHFDASQIQVYCYSHSKKPVESGSH